MYQPCTPYRWIETISVNYKHLILTRVSHILIKIVKLIKKKSNSIENTIIFVRCDKFHFVRCEFQVLFSKSAWESRHWGWNKTCIYKIFYTPSSNTNRQRCSVQMYLTLTGASSDTSNMYRKVPEQDLAHCWIHYLYCEQVRHARYLAKISFIHLCWRYLFEYSSSFLSPIHK